MSLWDHALQQLKGVGIPVPAKRCELCWRRYPTEEALRQHVEMEEMVDWPVDGTEERVDA